MDIVVFKTNISFALKSFIDSCHIEVLDDPNCLSFISKNEDKRGEGHAENLMKFILEHFRSRIHSLTSSLGFLEQLSKNFELERAMTYLSVTSFN